MIVNGKIVEIKDGMTTTAICDQIVEKSGTYDGRGLSMSFSPEEWNPFSAIFGSSMKFVAALIDYIAQALVRAQRQPVSVGLLVDYEGRIVQTF